MINEQFVGFDRELKLEWLDTTAGLYQQSADAEAVARQLDTKLEAEIAGTVARSKTITVLQRAWVKVSPQYAALRDEALRMIGSVEPGERLWLHWGLTLLAYPLFRDVASVVGHLSRLQGDFCHSQVHRRIAERWGERSTVRRASRRIIQSMVRWDVLQHGAARGAYNVLPPLNTDRRGLATWLLDCALRAHGAEQVLMAELLGASYLFPFDLTPFVGEVIRSGRFSVNHQGLDLVLVGPNGAAAAEYGLPREQLAPR